MEERYTNGECFTFHGISSGIKKIYLRQITKSSPTFAVDFLSWQEKLSMVVIWRGQIKVRSMFMLRAHHSFMHTNVNPCAHGIHKGMKNYIYVYYCALNLLWILQDRSYITYSVHCKWTTFVSLCRTIVNYRSALASIY